MNVPACFRCRECRALARAIEAAWRTDHHELRTRLRDVADSSGRDLMEFGIHWVFSLAAMPDEEMRALLETHRPRFALAMRKAAEHERTSGHSLKAWWTVLQYG